MSAVLPSPAERLAQTREHLRRALHDDSAAPRGAANDPVTGEPQAQSWLERLRSIPGAAIAVDAVGLWWTRHPMRVPMALALTTATSAARPLAQRHPLALVAGALVLGALFAWSRPWRWALKPALFAGLLPQLLLSALKAAPPQKDRPNVP